MALYQKYRPRSFADLVGQEFAAKVLRRALASGRASHAYLFFGARGTGKTSVARLVAKALNCEKPNNGDPCGQCGACREADAGSYPDCIEIDGASNRKVEHARELLEKIRFAPGRGKKKVYIIDEVHMLTREAFNALLKIMEEPPEYAHFLLATTELQKVPETIQSRCQVFAFRMFTPELIASRLKYVCEQEGIDFDDEGLALLARRAAGGLRDALSLLEVCASASGARGADVAAEWGLAPREALAAMLGAALRGRGAQAAAQLRQMLAGGRSAEDVLEQLFDLLAQEVPRATKSSAELLLRVSGALEQAAVSSKTATVPGLPLEMALLGMGREGFLEADIRHHVGEDSGEDGGAGVVAQKVPNEAGKKEAGAASGGGADKIEEPKEAPQKPRVAQPSSEESEQQQEETNAPASSSAETVEVAAKAVENENEQIEDKEAEAEEADAPAPSAEPMAADGSQYQQEEEAEKVEAAGDEPESQQQVWKAVLAAVRSPMARVALANATPLQLSSTECVLQFSAQSFCSALDKTDARAELMAALQAQLGPDVVLKTEAAKAAPAKTPAAAVPQPPSAPPNAAAKPSADALTPQHLRDAGFTPLP